MKSTATFLFLLMVFAAESQNLTIFKSNLSVKETTTKLENIILDKGLKFFETVHHHEIAIQKGHEIDSTNVILFEDPDLTSDLILCEQTSALDLPLKLMIWEENGDVYIGYIDPQLMRKRFMIQDCSDTLTKMTAMVVRIVNESLRTR